MLYLYEYLLEKTEVNVRQICPCKDKKGMWGNKFNI